MRWSIAPTDEFVSVWISLLRPTSLWVSGFLALKNQETDGPSKKARSIAVLVEISHGSLLNLSRSFAARSRNKSWLPYARNGHNPADSTSSRSCHRSDSLPRMAAHVLNN
jgi:hypothetical protein